LFCAAALCFIITTFGSAQMSERIMNSACSGAPCTLNVVEVAAAVVLALDPNPPLVRLAGERNLISRAHGLRKSAAAAAAAESITARTHGEQYLRGIDKKVGGRAEGIALRREEKDVSRARITNQSMYIRKSCGLMLKIIPFASFSRPP
jgi:hypothetical protein